MIYFGAIEHVSVNVDQTGRYKHTFGLNHLFGSVGVNRFGYPRHFSVDNGHVHDRVDLVFWVNQPTAFDHHRVRLRQPQRTYQTETCYNKTMDKIHN